MAQADSNRVKIRFSTETAWGENVAGPATTELRITSESLTHSKETVVSETLRSDRQRDSVLETAVSASGDINFELAYSDYESMFAQALRSTISSATVSDASTTFAASSITGAAATNFVASFNVGQFIKIKSTGYTDNDSVARISALTSTLITVTGTTLTASVGISAAITGRTLINGTTKSSYFMEADFTDLTAVKYFQGMRVDGMSINVASQQVITGVFSFVGKKGYTASTSRASTTTSAGTNTPMTAGANVTDIFENNVKLSTIVQSLAINLANNSRTRPQVGATNSAEPGDGGVDVSGNLTVYMEDKSLYDKMVDHTSSSIFVKMKDTSGNYIIVSMPTVYFQSGDPQAPGIDQDVFVSLDWTAIRNTTEDATIRMDFLPT